TISWVADEIVGDLLLIEEVDKLTGICRQLFAPLLPYVPPRQLAVPTVRVEAPDRSVVGIQLLGRDLGPAEPIEESFVEPLLARMFLDLSPEETHDFGFLLIFGSKRGYVTLEHAAIRWRFVR